MVGRRGYSPIRSSSYRTSSSRLSSSWSRDDRRVATGKLSAYAPQEPTRSRYASRYDVSSSIRRVQVDGRRVQVDDRYKLYTSASSYPERRDDRRPDLKRPRIEASSSRRDISGGYGKRRPLPSSTPLPLPPPSSLRSEHSRSSRDYRPSTSSISRREQVRRPLATSSRTTDKGRIGTTDSRRLNPKDQVGRRRLADTSSAIRRRRAMAHAAEFNRKLRLARIRRAVLVRRRTADRPSSKDTKRLRSKETTTEKDKAVVRTETKKATDEKSVKSDNNEDKSKKKSGINLTCPHCNFKAQVFRRYEVHLNSSKHLSAMRTVARKQKSIVNQMRLAQRNAQNDFEKGDESDLTSKTSFCPLCKLNYKQKKAVHQETEAHKNMKKFLMPSCKYCDLNFNSPMSYESHCCSIKHLKQKQRTENTSDESNDEVDLENFTTIDSIGEEVSDTEENKEPVVNIGIEQIQKIEVYYCNLCKLNLPRCEERDTSKNLSRHCKTRLHMKRYIRFKEDQDLEKRAEELQRKELAEKEKKEETPKGDIKLSLDKIDDDENIDEKELSSILMTADDKSSDDEDDSHINGERYDRFKLSEKNEDEVIKIEKNMEVNGTDDMN